MSFIVGDVLYVVGCHLCCWDVNYGVGMSFLVCDVIYSVGCQLLCWDVIYGVGCHLWCGMSFMV